MDILIGVKYNTLLNVEVNVDRIKHINGIN